MRHSLLVYVAHAPAVALLYNGQKPLLIIFARALCCAHSSLSAHNQMSFKKISNPTSAKLQISCCLFGLECAFPVATQADKSRGLSEFANCEGG
jgi:hypothetical protein